MEGEEEREGDIPFRLVLCENLALGVVADHLDIDETAKVELFGSEHRHLWECAEGELWLSSDEKKLVMKVMV